MNQFVLAIDIGSSSIRCSAYRIETNGPLKQSDDYVLHLEAKHSSSHKMQCVSSETSKIPALQVLEQVDECLDKSLSSLRSFHVEQKRKFQILCVGISSFVMNLLAVNIDTGDIVESFTYACREDIVIKKVTELESTLGEQRCGDLFQRTGVPLHSAYALPQLCHYYSSSSKLDHKIKFQTLSSMCLARWQNKTYLDQISYSEASWTGLLDVSKGTWDSTALSFLPDGIQQCLPIPVDPSQNPISFSHDKNLEKSHPYHIKLPELYQEGTVLYLGEGDGACANIGSKCTSFHRIAMTIGTSAAVRVCLPYTINSKSSPITISKGLFCYRINSNYILVGGALTDGGSVVEWIQSLLQLQNFSSSSSSSDKTIKSLGFYECMQQVQQLMKYQSNHKSKLIVIPFLSGERSTGFRAHATGCIFGVTRQTTPAKFVKACLEGVVLRLYAIVSLMLPILQQIHDSNARAKDQSGDMVIVASGTALEKNSVWRQMIANCMGYDVILDKEGRTESTSRGIARIITLAYLENIRSTNDTIFFQDEPLLVVERSAPNASMGSQMQDKDYWNTLRDKQEALIQAVSSLW